MEIALVLLVITCVIITLCMQTKNLKIAREMRKIMENGCDPTAVEERLDIPSMTPAEIIALDPESYYGQENCETVVYVEEASPQLTPEEQARQEQQNAELRAAVEQHNAPMMAKIKAARHLLTGRIWQDPDGKLEMIEQVFEGKMPSYLWYAMPDISFSESDKQHLRDLFFDGEASFGDIELHESSHQDKGIITGLRIRNHKRVATEVTINGVTCPLYQAGHNGGLWGFWDAPCIFFPSLYENELVAA